MSHFIRPIRFGKRTMTAHRGLSLVEVLMSTAIASTLLTAAAAAWCASTNAVEQNDQFYRATQSVRVSLVQMLTQVRRTTGVNGDGLGNHVDLYTWDSKHYVYQFSAAAQQLQLVDETNATPVTYVLANNVTAAVFTADMEPNPQTQILCAVHVTINITVQVGSNSIQLTGSATPRINVNY